MHHGSHPHQWHMASQELTAVEVHTPRILDKASHNPSLHDDIGTLSWDTVTIKWLQGPFYWNKMGRQGTLDIIKSLVQGVYKQIRVWLWGRGKGGAEFRKSGVWGLPPQKLISSDTFVNYIVMILVNFLIKLFFLCLSRILFCSPCTCFHSSPTFTALNQVNNG